MMDIDDKKAWLEKHGRSMEEVYDHGASQYFVRWHSHSGMRVLGYGDYAGDAYENVFLDVVDTLFHHCQ